MQLHRVLWPLAAVAVAAVVAPSIASFALTREACAAIDARLPCSLRWVDSPRASAGRELGAVVGAAVRESLPLLYEEENGVGELWELYKTDAAFADLVDRYQAAHRLRFPAETAEGEGFAEAAGITAAQWFMAQAQPELSLEWGLRRRLGDSGAVREGHCSDIGLAQGGERPRAALGHNEDWDAATARAMAMVRTPEWVAYVYPGYLAGTAWAANRWGLVFAMNTVTPLLRPTHRLPGGTPGYAIAFALRSVLGAASVARVVEALGELPTGYGYSLNVLSACEHRVVNIEGWGNSLAVTAVSPGAPGVTRHFNHFMHLNVTQSTAGDTPVRLACSERARFGGPADIRGFLGDYACPLFRTAETTGGDADTMATFVADSEARRVDVWRLPVGCDALLGSGGRCNTSTPERSDTLPWHFVCPAT
eukprot:m51a1_g10402 hypothetical protein (422) ;mRNA; f:95296-96561